MDTKFEELPTFFFANFNTLITSLLVSHRGFAIFNVHWL
jgi:hypothetical protein